ncbi:MAG: cytochrome oxidase assembly protein [Pirellulaceae bacterium]|nr:MAG: cytochrome oxidase assembly protein [Pirellulaceae bacterium]
MLNSRPGSSTADLRWTHRLAVVLAVATLLLIWVGAMVTTYQAGMAVPDWPTTYGYNLFLYPWKSWWHGPFDLFIEHGHRLLGAAVGLLVIGLVAVTWRSSSNGYLRWAVCGALALVIFQGLLGGMRVLRDARTLAMVHGCVAPLFFAYTIALCAVSSAWWADGSSLHGRPRQDLILPFGWAALAALLIYVQILVGAHVRHVPVAAEPGFFRAVVLFHLTLAAFVLLHVAGVGYQALKRAADRVVPRVACILASLLILQLVLGAGSWVLKYGWPMGLADRYRWAAQTTLVAGSLPFALTVTAHVTVGSLLLGLAVWLVLRTARPLLVEPTLAGEESACRGRSSIVKATGGWTYPMAVCEPAGAGQ